MNIQRSATPIKRETLIEMFDELINDAYSEQYYNINELDFIKEEPLVDKMLKIINDFSIKILDLNQASKQLPIDLFSHVNVNHGYHVTNGNIRNTNLNFDFILTINANVSECDYMELLFIELNNAGLPELDYPALANGPMRKFLKFKEYESPKSDKQVVRYYEDRNTIEVLDSDYNIIKDVMNIDYTNCTYEFCDIDSREINVILKKDIDYNNSP